MSRHKVQAEIPFREKKEEEELRHAGELPENRKEAACAICGKM